MASSVARSAWQVLTCDDNLYWDRGNEQLLSGLDGLT